MPVHSPNRTMYTNPVERNRVVAAVGDVAFWPIVLQKSFSILDHKISEPWARFSCKDMGGHMISRLIHQ
jgi:hypothetical protein